MTTVWAYMHWGGHCRVVQNAPKSKNLPSHKFFRTNLLSYAGKCQKSWKKLSFRGAYRPPLVYVLTASTKGRVFEFGLNFWSLPVLLSVQIPSQTIRHEKIHYNRHQDHQNRTIGARFSPRSVKVVLLYSRDNKLFDFWPISDHWMTSQVPGNPSNQQGTIKNVMLGTKAINSDQWCPI